ncbi:efflux transporter periplasmic adaptor subunit [Planctopirus hydrillae]|uniref:Efflux transporter periplasmic adaptor subunit n=2 Tax=Planctopirus hydrillae TaxID=1841610 RepID=A0A1C3EGV4_9PLAN|nr:efflux transporter periplasmic adaptor subunit [Planctopirus hydrillae]
MHPTLCQFRANQVPKPLGIQLIMKRLWNSKRLSLGTFSLPKSSHVLILCSMICLAASCSPQPKVINVGPRPVKTQVITSVADLRSRTFPGKVEASQRVELAFQVSGLLVDLPVKEGQRVAKGELIGQLRQDEFKARVATLQSQLDQARAGLAALMQGERAEERLRREAQVRAAQARLSKTRTEHERNTRLVTTNVVTRAQYEMSEAAYRVAQEELKAAEQLVAAGSIGREEDIQSQEAMIRGLEAQLVEANLNLQDSTLRAPYDGVIAQRFVEQGQNVRAKEPIVRFQDVDEVEILVDVPETVMVADITRADIVSLSATISGAPGVAFPVRIREIGQVADPVTQTFTVRVGMQTPAGLQVLPGMTANILATYRRAEVLGNSPLLVPVTALTQSETGQQIVWIIDEELKAQSREVKVGSATGSDIEILEGLAPGDRIAVAGVKFLRPGMQVRDLGDSLASTPSTSEGSTR